MQARQRILHVAKTQGVAGAENHLFQLLPALAKRGYKVGFLSLTDASQGAMSPAFAEKLESLSQAEVEVQVCKVGGRLDFSSILAMRKSISGFRPDCVHTHMPYADLFGALAARAAGVRTVFSSRHYDYAISRRERLRFQLYYRVANALHTKMIPISSHIAGLLKSEGISGKRIHLIPYGCSDQTVSDRSQARDRVLKELGFGPDTILLGTVARLLEWKGHRFAVEAMARLRELREFERVRWILVGEGPERESLEHLIAKNDLDGRMPLLGERRDIPELMAAMDVMIHPTTGEGFGLVLLESMIQSTPVISTQTGSIPEILRDGAGVLVEPSKPGVLSEAIARMMQDPGLRAQVGAAGRQRYEREYHLDVMLQRFDDLYRAL